MMRLLFVGVIVFDFVFVRVLVIFLGDVVFDLSFCLIMFLLMFDGLIEKESFVFCRSFVFILFLDVRIRDCVIFFFYMIIWFVGEESFLKEVWLICVVLLVD